MILSTNKNWKQFLSIRDEEKLNEILRKNSKYRGAYKNADDVKIAQIWCSILELNKQTDILQKRIDKIQFLIEGMFERNNEQMIKDREIIRSLERF